MTSGALINVDPHIVPYNAANRQMLAVQLVMAAPQVAGVLLDYVNKAIASQWGQLSYTALV